jgi:hypothetical protein
MPWYCRKLRFLDLFSYTKHLKVDSTPSNSRVVTMDITIPRPGRFPNCCNSAIVHCRYLSNLQPRFRRQFGIVYHGYSLVTYLHYSSLNFSEISDVPATLIPCILSSKDFFRFTYIQKKSDGTNFGRTS